MIYVFVERSFDAAPALRRWMIVFETIGFSSMRCPMVNQKVYQSYYVLIFTSISILAIENFQLPEVISAVITAFEERSVLLGLAIRQCARAYFEHHLEN